MKTENKKRGRPCKNDSEKVVNHLHIRLNDQDLLALNKVCALVGTNKTEFLRSCIKDKLYDLEFDYGYSGYDSDEDGLEKD